MRKDLTEVVFILDRSGSMRGLEADTIGGFNSLLEKQRKEEGEALISTVLFDDKSEVIYDRVDVKKMEDMTDRQYYVRGCTALLDAIGGSIKHISGVHKKLPGDQVPEKTIFIITTDGMENASRKYNYEKVKKMVEKQQKKHNWEFMFLGANIDAISEAAKFGIGARNAVRYECDSKGTFNNFRALGRTVSAVRKATCRAEMDMAIADCCMSIAEDYNERGNKGDN